jgi:hypothetical protein
MILKGKGWTKPQRIHATTMAISKAHQNRSANLLVAMLVPVSAAFDDNMIVLSIQFTLIPGFKRDGTGRTSLSGVVNVE